MGDPLILALVATSDLPKSCAINCSKGAYGSITPSRSSPGASSVVARVWCMRALVFTSTMGASRLVNLLASSAEISVSCFNNSMEGYNTAKGFDGRCFRSLSVFIAIALAASTISRNPPMPFMARMFPARIFSIIKGKISSC